MTTIKGMLNKVTELNRTLPDAVTGIIQKTSYEITSLNQQQLYNYGVDSDGHKLEQYLNKYYAKEKNYMNRRPGYGTPDLFLTGVFYKGFTATAIGYGFKVDSIDSKSEDLKKKYGQKIFGLTKDNRRVYALGVFYTEFKKFVTLKTGLTFE